MEALIEKKNPFESFAITDAHSSTVKQESMVSLNFYKCLSKSILKNFFQNSMVWN